MFDLNSYRECNQKIIKLLTNMPESGKGYILDGIKNPAIYAEQKLKLLFVLSEGYDKAIWPFINIEVEEQYPIERKKKIFSSHWKSRTMKNVLKLSFNLLNASNMTEYQQTNSIFNKEKGFETLQKIAWINVKKSSNRQSEQDNNLIYNTAKQNKDILELQIEAIKPDLILLCGNSVISAFVDSQILGAKFGSKKQILQKINDKNVICLYHPAARPNKLKQKRWDEIKIFETIKNNFSF